MKKGFAPTSHPLVPVLGLVLLALAVLSAPASASPWNRSCGTARDGFLTPDPKWEVVGPYQIGMSYTTAKGIAQRVGPNEFAPPGSHPAARDVPCDAAFSIAMNGAKAWTKWPGNSGWMGAGWIGYATGPYYGSFHCTGVSQADGGARETCHHNADRHAGAMTGRFVIHPAPSS